MDDLSISYCNSCVANSFTNGHIAIQILDETDNTRYDIHNKYIILLRVISSLPYAYVSPCTHDYLLGLTRTLFVHRILNHINFYQLRARFVVTCATRVSPMRWRWSLAGVSFAMLLENIRRRAIIINATPSPLGVIIYISVSLRKCFIFFSLPVTVGIAVRVYRRI